MNSVGFLFTEEERAVVKAEQVLSPGDAVVDAGDFAVLLNQYKKLHRQSMRLVKMGDRMQGQLNRLNERLTISEEKYRRIFESSVQGIFRSTAQGRFLDLNPAMAKIFGYGGPTEMMQAIKDIAKDIFLCPEQRENMLNELRRQGLLKDYSLQLRRRDGQIIWVEICARGVFDAHNNLMELEGLVADVTERRRMLQELEDHARRDGLTGLWNRRYFMELGQREFYRAERDKTPLSLVYFDLDYFKNINDTYGHEAGDEVLREIAVVGGKMLRKIDIFGRMGGEEFAILLPGANRSAAWTVAEKVRGTFESHTVRLPLGGVRFTASFGLAQAHNENACLESLIKLADDALYKAKRAGRNRIVCMD